ncbi:MAG TPA: hypothetical protein VI037_02890 [Nitrososphaera sp.]
MVVGPSNRTPQSLQVLLAKTLYLRPDKIVIEGGTVMAKYLLRKIKTKT